MVNLIVAIIFFVFVFVFVCVFFSISFMFSLNNLNVRNDSNAYTSSGLITHYFLQHLQLCLYFYEVELVVVFHCD